MENRRGNKWELLGLPTEEEVEKKIKARDEAAIERFDFGKIPATGTKTETEKYRFWVEQDGALQEVSWIGPAGGKQKDRHMSRDALGNQLASETNDRFETEERDAKRLARGTASPTYRAMRDYNNALEGITSLPLQAKAQRRNKLLAEQLGKKYRMLFQEIADEGDETTLNDLAQSEGWVITSPDAWAKEIESTEPPQWEQFDFDLIPPTGQDVQNTSFRFWIDVNGFQREVSHISPAQDGPAHGYHILSGAGQPIEGSFARDRFFLEKRSDLRLAQGRKSRSYQAMWSYYQELRRIERIPISDPTFQTREKRARSIWADFKELLIQTMENTNETLKLNELARKDNWTIAEAQQLVERLLSPEPAQEEAFSFKKISTLGVSAADTPFRFWIQKHVEGRRLWREVATIAREQDGRDRFYARGMDKKPIERGLDRMDFVRELRTAKRLADGRSSLTFQAIESYLAELDELPQHNYPATEHSEISANIRSEIRRLVEEIWQGKETDRFIDLVHQAELSPAHMRLLNEYLNLAMESFPQEN